VPILAVVALALVLLIATGWLIGRVQQWRKR